MKDDLGGSDSVLLGLRGVRKAMYSGIAAERTQYPCSGVICCVCDLRRQ